MKTYKAWVPTVSGRLSFDVIGGGVDPRYSAFANVADKNERFFVCHQRRVLLDGTLPAKEFFSKLLFNLDGRFYFLCIGESSNSIKVRDDYLKGKILIFNENAWLSGVQDGVTEFRKKLLGFNKLSSPGSLWQHVRSHQEALLKELPEKSWFYADFALARTGIVTFGLEDDPVLAPNAPEFPEDKKPKMEHIVCAQLYFFLKDIIHTHQHHDPTTDTMLDIHLLEDEDDYTWRSETLRLLYRKVLQYKRSRKEEIFSSALGTLAYIKSFRKISEDELGNDPQYLKNNQTIMPVLNDEYLKDSILASQGALRNTIQDRIRELDVIRNTLIGIIGSLLALVGLIKLTSIQFEANDTSKVLIFMGKALTHTPIITLSLLCAILLVILMFFNVIAPRNWKFIRGIFRIIQALNRPIAVVILLILFALTMAATIWFVWFYKEASGGWLHQSCNICSIILNG